MRIALLVTLALLATACASTGYSPRPFPTPGGSPGGRTEPPAGPTPGPESSRPPSGTPVSDGYALAGTALGLRGAPYRNGGADPRGFDCSGFVQYVFGRHGLAVPRDVRRQFDLGREVNLDGLAPGDLVFFTTTAPGASHVGIALGGDQFVHAPSSSGVVRVEHLSARYWASRYIGARRVKAVN
jgi:cell wall-associated NlpC family hydrolase